MGHQVVAILSIVLLLVCLFIVYKVLFRRGWLIQWIKGSAGFVMLLLCVLLGLAAWDLFSYENLKKEEAIATLSFSKLGAQKFKVMIVDRDGEEQAYALNGDLWQLDARLITWTGPIQQLGVMPAYKLDRISGRYLSLEQERMAERSVFGLSDDSVLDVWHWLHEYPGLPLLNAAYGSATYMPMADGAIYQVRLDSRGVSAKPMNEVAMSSVKNWQ
jgi:hypothetical protein